MGQYPSFLRTLGISEQTNMVVFAMTVVGPSTILLRPPEAAVCPGKIELCTSYLLFQSHYTLPPIIVVAEPLVQKLNYYGQLSIIIQLLGWSCPNPVCQSVSQSVSQIT